jgi:hypothetical protein
MYQRQRTYEKEENGFGDYSLGIIHCAIFDGNLRLAISIAENSTRRLRILLISATLNRMFSSTKSSTSSTFKLRNR